MPDAIDAAVVTANAGPPERRAQVNVTISSTGRQVLVNFPVDLADAEIVELVGWIGTQLAGACRAERAKGAAGRIVVPSGITLGAKPT